MRQIDVIMITITALAVAVTLPAFGKGHTLDFGNTSDIVSAMCNIAMAGAAVYAAMNANTWLAQKKYESALNHISNLLEERDRIIEKIAILYFDVTSTRGDENKKNEVITQIKKLVGRIFLLKKSLDACNRWNVVSPDILYKDNSALNEYCYTCLTLLELTYPYPYPQKDEERLNSLKITINENSEFCKKRIDEIFKFP